MSAPRINDAASRGFEGAAREYERARPSYPAVAVDYLCEILPIGPTTRVMDLAAGTGKLTRLLVPRAGDVLAVEPVEAMRQALQDAVPGAEVVPGTAEAIPVADGAVDAVTVAQAFHWFDAGLALAEIARVLRPGGGLGLMWNVRDESIDWVRQFTEITVRHSGGVPYRRDYTFDRWQREFASSRQFTSLAARRFRYEQSVDIDLVVERAASISFVAALPAHDRSVCLAEVRTMLETHPELAGRPTFPFPYETDVYWCHRHR